jgi:hypothetical protein
MSHEELYQRPHNARASLARVIEHEQGRAAYLMVRSETSMTAQNALIAGFSILSPAPDDA